MKMMMGMEGEESKGMLAYEGWDEVNVSNEKGRREVHFYLKRSDGFGGFCADLAVIGKEKSVRHMSYSVQTSFLLRTAAPSLKLRSRREVIEWLSSFVPMTGGPLPSPSSSSSMTSQAKVCVLIFPEPLLWQVLVIFDDGGKLTPRIHLLLCHRRTQLKALLHLFRPLHIKTGRVFDSVPLEKLFRNYRFVPVKVLSCYPRFLMFMWAFSSDSVPCGSSPPSYNDEDAYPEGVPTSKVHDFVYVMAEENKRLVAYLEDLYEDSRANNMVSVRWFHNIDEVGIVLPPDFNDREIFFSLCLQDLSVECIDGIASVLNPQHFEKFLNEARHTHWEPYLCYRQFDNDDVKPFDITQVQGYWNQELLRYMYTFSSKSNLKPTSSVSFSLGGNGHANMVQSRPKRKHEFKNGETNQHHKAVGKESSMNSNGLSSSTVTERPARRGGPASSLSRKVIIKQNPTKHLSVGCSVEVLSQDSGIRGCWFRGIIIKRHRDKLKIRYQDILDADELGNLEEWVLASRVANSDELGFRLHGRTAVRPNPPTKGKALWGFEVGTAVDARWHDGWWEGIVVHKEPGDKVHVYFPGIDLCACSAFSYQIDKYCTIHFDHCCHVFNFQATCGDATVATAPEVSTNDTVKEIFTCAVLKVGFRNVDKSGSGLLAFCKKQEGSLRKSRERQFSIFAPGDLRHSMEWACNKWNDIKVRPDLVNSISSDQRLKSHDGAIPTEALASDKKSPGMEKMASDGNTAVACNGTGRGETLTSDEKKRKAKAVEMPIILSKDRSFAELRWNSSSKKRRRGRESLGKSRQNAGSGSSSSSHEDGEPPAREDFSILKSLKVDRENCKYGGDHIFVASIPPLTSLVVDAKGVDCKSLVRSPLSSAQQWNIGGSRGGG
ncbi:hypothetical protein ACLOJK_034557 [Asimina triloba]